MRRFLAVAVLAVGSLSGASISFSNINPTGSVNSPGTLQFSTFDMTLGTLTGISVQLSYSSTASAIVANPLGASATFLSVTASIPFIVTFTGGPGGFSFTGSAIDTAGGTVASGTSFAYNGVTGSGSSTFAITPSAVYTSTSSSTTPLFSLSAPGNATVNGIGTAGLLYGGNASAFFTGTITYTYTPAGTKRTPTVTFTGAPASAPEGSTFVVAATTNASTTAVITASGACSNVGSTITVTSPAGTCLLTAAWDADTNFNSAMATQTTTAAPPPIIYISDSQNNRIRAVNAYTGVITTVAGNGTAGYSGDGGPATSARLNHPTSVVVDGSGNLFIADSQNYCVRKVGVSGLITTVAGVCGVGFVFSGDGGPATSAFLEITNAIAVDGLGNLYIAADHRVRKVDTAGIITTFAGNGVTGSDGDGGPAVLAQLFQPTGLAADALGNLYIADPNNQEIRMVSATSGNIATVAGNGNIGYNCKNGLATGLGLHSPYGVALNASADTFFVADAGNQCIRQVNSGTMSTVAGNGLGSYSGDGGAATSAALNHPTGVALDNSGNIYIADSSNNCIRVVNAITGNITTFAGNGNAGFSGDGGPATTGHLYQPTGVAVFNPSGT